MNAELARSAIGVSAARTGSAFFSTGTDSPVRDDSSTRICAASIRRRSAGTIVPASRRTTSPGTRSRARTVVLSPSRTTWASGAAISLRLCSACSARLSCVAPTNALRITIARMMTESSHPSGSGSITCTISEMSAAARRIHTTNPRSCATSRFQNGVGGVSGRAFGP